MMFQYFPEVIRYVNSLNPFNILKEDKNCMDVLEYAKGKEVDYSIVRMLQEMRICAIRKELCPCDDVDGKDDNQKIKRTSFTQKVKKNTLRKFASSRY